MTQKFLRADGLTNSDLAEQKYSEYVEIIPEGVTFQDVLDVGFWMHHKHKRVHDIIRCIAADASFDVFVTIRAIVGGGLVVDFLYGKTPAGLDPSKVAAEALARNREIKIVPLANDLKPMVRVQHTPKTGWRVIGLESSEVARDLPTKEAAETSMAIYLASVNHRLPTDAEHQAMIAELNKAKAPKEPAKV